MSRTLYNRVERSIVGLMLLGMVGMFQPLSVDLYRYGFLLLLASTILFIIISHLAPTWDPSDAGAISLEQVSNQVQGHEQ